MDSLQSLLQSAISLENRLKEDFGHEDLVNIFEDYLNAGIDQIEIACQMQIARNERDTLTITVVETLLKHSKQPAGFTDKVLDNLMVRLFITLLHFILFSYLN